jgi:hypothetical protein
MNCVCSVRQAGLLLLQHCYGQPAGSCANGMTRLNIVWLHSEWSVLSLFASLKDVRLLMPVCVTVCLCVPCVCRVCQFVPGVLACAGVCLCLPCVCRVCQFVPGVLACAGVCLCVPCVPVPACLCLCLPVCLPYSQPVNNLIT